jgi:tetratricopeptide (TPR) repeat protein
MTASHKKTPKTIPRAPENNEAQPTQERNKKIELLIPPAMIVLTIVVFHNSLRNAFINSWDDHVYIIANEYLRDLSAQGIKSIFTSFYAANYHPLTTLSWAVEYTLFGLEPTYYHATNLFLHVVNVLLVFRLMQWLAESLEVATIVALFFAVHPLHVEAVCFVSQRKDLLYSVFFLGALISYVRHVRRNVHYRYLLVALFFFVLSLLSKSMAVTLPVVLLLIDYYLKRKFTRSTLFEKIPFFLLSFAFGIMAILSQKTYAAITTLPSFSLFERIFLVSYGAVFYLVKLVAPFSLSAFYTYPEKTKGMLPIEYYMAPVVIIILCFLVYRTKAFRRELFFGLSFFAITISLVLQIVPVGSAIVAERYTYVPYIGLFFLYGQCYRRISEKKVHRLVKLKSVMVVLLAVFTVVFSAISWQRTKVWADSFTLWSDVIKKYPQTTVAYYNRGVTKFNTGDYQGAVKDYDLAVSLNPAYAEAFNNRGEAKEKQGNYEGAIDDYNSALSSNPDYIGAYLNRAQAKVMLKDYGAAIEDYGKVIQRMPYDSHAYIERANLKSKLKRYEEAITDLNKVIGLDPDRVVAYNNRGIAKAILKDYQGAMQDFNQAIRLKPDYREARKNRDRVESYLNVLPRSKR